MSTEPASRPSRSGSTVGGSVLEQLREPIVQAPMAGGPSTPALAGAVCEAGGLGFLASGMKTVEALRAELDALRGLTREPFGVNLFLLSEAPVDEQALEAYVARLQPEGERYGVELGRPRHDDDGWEAKLELLAREGAAVVSFTFGCPSREAVDVLHRAGAEAWVTVTGPEEAGEAQAAGADVLVVQGVEAGGHRGSFSDRDGSGELGLLPHVAARRARELQAARRGGRHRRRPCRRRGARGRCFGRAGGHRLPAHP